MILDEIDDYLARFVAFPSEPARHAVCLWIAHTHLIDCFESTPRLVLSSAEKQSGKTRCLEIISLLVPTGRHTASISPAALFRLIEEGPTPTILFDEFDTVFGDKSKDGSEDMRSLINSGHRRGALTYRCQMPSMKVKAFPVFAPIALAGIGHLPDTITDRSVLIQMRRRSPAEVIESFRIRIHEPIGLGLQERLADWAQENSQALDGYIPNNPLEDRPADVWEPLLAIGEIAGQPWAARSFTAAQTLSNPQNTAESLGVELLRNIRTVWPAQQTSLTVSALITSLCEVEEMRWAEHHGRGLNPRSLSQILKKFEVQSRRTAEANVYDYSSLRDAWVRYLGVGPPSLQPPQPPQPPQMDLMDEMDLLRKEGQA